MERTSNLQRPTSNVQGGEDGRILIAEPCEHSFVFFFVGRWALDVQRWAFDLAPAERGRGKGPLTEGES